MKKIRTSLTNIFSDTEQDLGVIGNVMDVSFKNIGLTAVTINTIDGKFTLQPAEPMVTFGGYENYYRTDTLKIAFAGGTGNLLLFMNIHTNPSQC